MKLTQSAACLLVVVAGLWMAAVPAHAAEDEARVLILNGVDPYLPAYLAIDNAMRTSLASYSERRVVYFSEQLDAQRFQLDSLEAEVVAFFARKYRSLRVDVVVAVTQPALGFFKRHGEQLWPGARVVFLAFPGEVIETAVLPPNATGAVASQDVGGTIEVARRLQPDARHILVVSGASELDQGMAQDARVALSAIAKLPPVEFLSGLPLPELVDLVAKAPADAIVVYLAQFRDRDGRPYTPREVLRAISVASKAPVYGIAETYIGAGAAAGSMESYADRGQLVAGLVREALAGDPPAPDRALRKVSSRCVADARALQRWSLDERLLPDGCDIRFADRPFWRQYLWEFVAVLAVIFGQGLLITALLVQRRRRRVAEAAVQTQRVELAHASRLAVAGELTAAIAHEINQPLGAILSNAEAADLLLQSGEDRGELLREILADIRRDDLRASEVIRRLRTLLARHETEQEPFDLSVAATEVASLLQSEAERRRVTINMRLAPVAPMTGDRIQVEQVLINLVINAMDSVSDFGEDRRTILVEVDKSVDRIRIAVRDRGRGIAPADLPKLFDSFYTTKPTGMGLGLSIARTIVEAHHGRIWVESLPGDGAVFHIEFPATDPLSVALRGGDVS